MKKIANTLKNGLRVQLIPLKGTRTVTVLVLFGTGSKYETKKINGLSHFLEHLFFKGTKKRPTTKLLTEELDKVGAVYNAFTGKEETGYWIKMDASHLELALDITSDMLLNALFDAKEIEREKGVIIEEINMYRDLPISYVPEIFEELIYGNTPAGWDIAGEPNLIKKMTKKQILEYRERQYVASNAVVTIAGNINPKTAGKLVEKYYKKFKAGTADGKKEVTEVQKKPQVKIKYKKTDQTHIVLGCRAYKRTHKDRYTLEVLATILGGNMSSRLFINVRERLGIAYYIRAGVEDYTDHGYLAVAGGIQKRSTEIAIKTILKELRDLKNKRVSVKELSKAKEYLKGKTQIALEASHAVANYWAEQEILDNKTTSVQNLFKNIDKVTPADIQRVAKVVFKNDKLNLAMIGDEKSESKFEKILKI
jgi:predicted Zn-dependent peptidase